ncbi:MAG: hypothetical protein HZB39_00735 [Planctomycetes bacterium]|nr:hypothetical protein [Planctomycetota bacterium]
MTGAGAAETPSLARLLQALDRDPRALIDDLRRARESATSGGPDAAELDLAELEYLRRRARDPRLAQDLAARTVDARRLALEVRLRDALARPEGDHEVLFELAELRAEFLLLEADGPASDAARARDERIARCTSIDDSLRFAAAECWVELSTEEEDYSLRQKVALLEEVGAVYRALADRSGDRELRRLARRARNAAIDRRLQLRLERVLGVRGARVFETTSLLLLLVVFALVFVQILAPRDEGERRWLLIADASICTYFVAEFLFRLALAPARGSWFLRNAVTDLLPALPAAMWFVAIPGAELAGAARALRFLRAWVWIARYLQAMRPLVAVLRLVLFLVRGFDALVRRFSRLLNRDFVFFERVVVPLSRPEREDDRNLAFRALRREHVLLTELPIADAAPILRARADALATRLGARTSLPRDDGRSRLVVSTRDVPVEHAIEYLGRIRPAELGTYLPRRDVLALDRLVRVINAPLVRWLPILWSLRSPRAFATPEERVVDFGRRVALLLEKWRDRALHWADLHGIVTGPQVLDRVASAIVRASQRPAVRLLLFGGLFSLVRMVLGADSSIGGFLARFVATPLVILGGACLVFLALGRWLKALAGAAADAFRLTSEVHFLNLTELVKQRHEASDLSFVAERVFRGELETWRAAGKLQAMLAVQRTGNAHGSPQVGDAAFEARLQRIALLYLHFLDGAPLHQSDVRTTEQLLANLSLQNIRNVWLGTTRRDRRRLRALSLVEGSLFRGPYVWFQFIAESVAVETAKLVTEWNRNCMTRERRRLATAEERAALARWLRERRSANEARVERTAPPGSRELFHTTEFQALDFLTIDPLRMEHLAQRFGRGVVRLAQRDRERMIREIFGMRPLHDLPRSRRTLNFVRFWEARLSRGRVFFAPLYFARLFFAGFRMTIARLVRIVREILWPETAARTRERGRAPFAVALRKIQRMKGPGLLEAMRLRAAVDPEYAGAPASWSCGASFATTSELERDMDFLCLREREREPLRWLATRARERVVEFHTATLAGAIEVAVRDERERKATELAATVAYVADRDAVRTLFRAEEWFARLAPELDHDESSSPAHRVRRAFAWLGRGCKRHPVDRWLDTASFVPPVGRRVRERCKRLWHVGDADLRRSVVAWLQVPGGLRPADEARRRLDAILRSVEETVRDLGALRAVQSLAVLDVRNYRELVFALGGYARDGEDDALARALP